jgi:hypothetical protein
MKIRIHCIVAAFVCLLIMAVKTGRAAPPEASVRVHSVRINRSSTEFNKKFSSRNYVEGGPGVSMQLLLNLAEGTLLPPNRDALAIETFVDDTYQSLVGSANESYNYGSGNGPFVLSEDGRSLLFTVGTSRIPAEDAGRVFVRGYIQARLSHDKPTVIARPLMLVVGQGSMVGPFRTVIRSISDQGAGSGLAVSIAIDGDASRIQRVRILDNKGAVLTDPHPSRPATLESGDRNTTFYLQLHTAPTNLVTVEYTYLEKIEQVRIPFEAQVDFGVAKAGRIEPWVGPTPKRTGPRTWPPEPEHPRDTLPPRRSAFDPDAKPRAAEARLEERTMEKAAVDLFSVTVAKPAPNEAKQVKWKHPPPPTFYASGFTIARLMLSTPGATILSVPSDGVKVKRFEDDKGSKLDTALYRESSYLPANFPLARVSPDGEQVLLNLSLAAVPETGATRFTLAGDVQAKVAFGNRTNTTGKLELKTGEKFKAGPFTGAVSQIVQSAPSAPGSQDSGDVQVWLSISGPISRMRSIEFLGNADAVLNRNQYSFNQPTSESVEQKTESFRLNGLQAGPVTLRFHHYDTDETIKVPFEITTSIGL